MDNPDQTTSSRAIKDQALFNEIAKAYLSKDLIPSSRASREQRLRATLACLPKMKFSRVLEVGCGGGFAVNYACNLFEYYEGIDYAQELIDYAIKYHQTDHQRFHCCDAFEFKIEEPFDLIFMIGVLHHVEDDVKLMRHLTTLMKPGGWLIVNEPQAGNPLIRALRQGRKLLDKEFSEDQVEYRSDELERNFKDAGLVNLIIRGQGLFSTPFAEVPMRPRALSRALSGMAIKLDRIFENKVPNLVKRVGWNLVAAGRHL